MPRDLFGDVSDPSVRVGSRKWYTVPLSLVVHTVVLLLVVVIPLVATGALPDPRRIPDVFTIIEPKLPDMPPARRSPEAVKPRPDPDAFPTEAPASIEPASDLLDDSDLGAPDVEGLVPGGFVDGKGTPEPPPPPPPPTVQKPVHVGGNIRAPERIQYVAPTYPPIAQQARMEGIVIIEATIGVDGRVINARVLRSRPMLDDAALAAVREWLYTPTTLNGIPVPVIMTITVHFTLQK